MCILNSHAWQIWNKCPTMLKRFSAKWQLASILEANDLKKYRHDTGRSLCYRSLPKRTWLEIRQPLIVWSLPNCTASTLNKDSAMIADLSGCRGKCPRLKTAGHTNSRKRRAIALVRFEILFQPPDFIFFDSKFSLLFSNIGAKTPCVDRITSSWLEPRQMRNPKSVPCHHTQLTDIFRHHCS